MNEARERGWFIKALYVRVPVKTAVDRAMLRKRKVAPEKIAAYQAKIAPALAIASKHSDEFEVVDHTFDMQEHVRLGWGGEVSAVMGW